MWWGRPEAGGGGWGLYVVGKPEAGGGKRGLTVPEHNVEHVVAIAPAEHVGGIVDLLKTRSNPRQQARGSDIAIGLQAQNQHPTGMVTQEEHQNRGKENQWCRHSLGNL